MPSIRLLLFLFFISSCIPTFLAQRSVLNLSKKGLKEIPSHVFERKDLKVLKLFGNQIDSIGPEIAQLVNLEKLYLGRNNLKILPTEIGSLKKLKVLSLSYNKLDSLPISIGGLESLQQLWLDQNELRTLPSSIGDLTNLETLQLRYNWLDSIPATIGNCENLQFIYLNRNNLVGLPGSFGKLRKLRELYVSNAGPSFELPQELCNLRLLEVLQIDENTIIPACLFVIQTTRLRIIQD
jgi:Leucine-rich repeat (LRR) protein